MKSLFPQSRKTSDVMGPLMCVEPGWLLVPRRCSQLAIAL